MLNFNDFLWQVTFKIFKILRNHARLERIPPYVSLFETFAFVTISKLLSSKSGEIFCGGLRWMCKLFKINGQKDF